VVVRPMRLSTPPCRRNPPYWNAHHINRTVHGGAFAVPSRPTHRRNAPGRGKFSLLVQPKGRVAARSSFRPSRMSRQSGKLLAAAFICMSNGPQRRAAISRCTKLTCSNPAANDRGPFGKKNQSPPHQTEQVALRPFNRNRLFFSRSNLSLKRNILP